MRYLIFNIILSVLIVGCSSSTKQEEQSEKPITNDDLLVVDTNNVFEHFEDVQVFQYFGNDSLNGKITHSRKLDANGNVIAEYYKDYKTDKGNGRADILEINEYNGKNQLIISTSYFETFQRGEVTKSFYYYKDTLVVRVESFEFKRRMRSDVDKGLGSPGGCIVTSEDYEKERTWKVSRIVLYEYDSNGRKTLSYSPIFNSSYNRFKYQYDTDGNLTVEKSLDESRHLYTTNYQYQLNQTISDLQWDNKDWGGTKRIKTFDNNGNLVKESTIQKNKEWIDIYKYNIEGKLVRFIAYDNDGEINLTHIYVYKK
jgi:hypothetical protein